MINLIDKNTVEAGAATLDRKISNFAKTERVYIPPKVQTDEKVSLD